ncbi:Major facilitator superfamily protein [Spironucleus salmonicida]|uniref:Lysosomal dipeptide transporter MFSD1 n=1 Tax=Spironucleus salmonicida TaxID=348837 RepID=V6LAD6_9EUKA|nr:Major facilitator superfamily protein [Spironucleus salmonicida]|eukprot:EST41367.1 Major facilitator superfamily protein [Spironucleus salmonicida]
MHKVESTSRHVNLISQLKKNYGNTQIRVAIPTMFSRTTIFSNSQVSHVVPLYSNIRSVAKPQVKPESKGVEPSIFQIISTFISATLAAFSGLYIADSIAAQQIYMQQVMPITDSQLGLLSSCIFFPSLFMPIICAPILDRIGSIWSGIGMNIFNCLVAVPMVFVSRNYQGLFWMRILAGLFQEASFSVQSGLIVQYLPAKLSSLGFGVCMSIATSANLISFFVIPVMMKGLVFKVDGTIDENTKFLVMYQQTFWLNFYVSVVSLVGFIGFCLPLMKLDKDIKAKEEQNNKIQPQAEQFDDSISDNLDSEDSMDKLFNHHIQAQQAIIESNKQMQELFAKKLKNVPKTPNNMSFIYKIFKYFSLSLDFWLINITFCQLLSICYGAQTMLITYLAMHVDYAEMAGIVRSIASILGGPISGLLVQFVGQRPVFQFLAFIITAISFVSLLFFGQITPYIGMFIIGFFDGSASALGKSLFTYVCTDQQLNAAYAVSGVILSIGQFVYPPISGMLSVMNWPNQGSGIIWFWVFMLIVGVLLSFVIIIRDKKFYGSVLSKKPAMQ